MEKRAREIAGRAERWRISLLLTDVQSAFKHRVATLSSQELADACHFTFKAVLQAG